jgi:uncharacterized OB-fold protein
MNELQEVGEVGPEAVFREGLQAGELRYQSCTECKQAVFQPRVLCPFCGSTFLSWLTSSGRGTVYSVTTVRAKDERYNVSLIDLDEGFRMMSRVDESDPDSVRIGTRVEFSAVDELGDPIAVFKEFQS